MKRLVLTIEYPDFNLEGVETIDDVEVVMDLASMDVVTVFHVHEGDSPLTFLQSLAGHILKFEVRDTGAVGLECVRFDREFGYCIEGKDCTCLPPQSSGELDG